MIKRAKTKFEHKVQIGQMPALEIVHKDLVISVKSRLQGKAWRFDDQSRRRRLVPERSVEGTTF